MIRNQHITWVLMITLLQGCGLWESKPNDTLNLVKVLSTQLDVPEPSGLTLGLNGQLYTVSDPPNNRVYVLDAVGNYLKTLSYHGDDLEGVSFDPQDSTLWIIEEGLSELVHIDTSGEELSRWQVAFEVDDMNQGFEGILRDVAKNEIIIATQAGPPNLIMLDSNMQIRSVVDMAFASNLTGICRGRSVDEIFLISDKDQKLFIWSETEGLLGQYHFGGTQIEGVAFDEINGRIYLVSDSKSELYVYQFPESEVIG